jgi:tetratricopeptide (TPR) repeat protein
MNGRFEQRAANLESEFGRALDAHRRGALAEAETGYRRVLEFEPTHIDALGNLGVALQNQGRSAEAVACYRTAIGRAPGLAALWTNLGSALREADLLDDARDALLRATELDPGSATAHLNLGNVLRAQGNAAAALGAFECAESCQPGDAAVVASQGLALKDMGSFGEAITAFRRALTIAPANAEIQYNLGNTLRLAGDLDGAAAALGEAVRLNPAHVAAWCNVGVVEREAGELDAAVAAFDAAISINPDCADAHWNRAIALLLAGRWQEGFRAYTSRWAATGTKSYAPDAPSWDGAPLNGRRIVLWAEQGLGDAIQFARYVPLVAARGGRVTVMVHAPLMRLFESLAGVEAVLPLDAERVANDWSGPACDFQVALMDLPAIFGTTPETVPDAPYLSAPGTAEGALAGALDVLPKDVRRVGIVWAGNPDHANDFNRSLPAHFVAELGKLPGVGLISFQKGKHTVTAASALPLVADLAPHLDDFSATAAAIEAMDLVITVDTALAHLAGALGKPTWLLLPHAPDWRWLLNRDDSPWYPTMRLYRQATPGDWSTVIGRVVDDLLI